MADSPLVTARVTLIQRFYNATPTRTGRAKYCFPVPASAAICAFQFKSSDGRILRGECKEKDLAQEQYEAAVASGQMAGLLEYVTDDSEYDILPPLFDLFIMSSFYNFSRPHPSALSGGNPSGSKVSVNPTLLPTHTLHSSTL